MHAIVSSAKELLASLLQRLRHSMQNFNGSDQPMVQDPKLLEPLLQPMVQVMQESAKLSGVTVCAFRVYLTVASPSTGLWPLL
jgi:hypothetical protein